MSSKPIPKSGKVDDLVAPTPQNTPATKAQPAPITTRLSVPQTVEEDDEDDDEEAEISGNAARQAILNNPAFASLVQSRLSSLIGQSTGYVESLPQAIKSRLTGLKGLQAAQNKIEADFQKDLLELERKYVSKFAPIFDRRKDIILGNAEPNEEEIESGVKEEEKDAEEAAEEEAEGNITEPGRAATASEISQAPKGIPEFWLTAMKNHLGISELVTERDETLLKDLTDIRVSYPEGKPGFTLTFFFDAEKAKEWFSNEGGVLTKTYLYKDEVAYDGDFVFDKAEGTKIDWKDGKNLTVKIEKKKQRNKNTGQTRLVKKAVPTESFFTFFTPPSADDENEEEDEEDLLNKMELDYQIGVDFRERFIPRAVDYFTGKALRWDTESFGEDWDDDEDALDDSDEDEDDEIEPKREKVRKAPKPPNSGTPGSATEPPECKNQ